MKYKRPLVLDIITWFHSLLLFACVYPLLASLVSFKGVVFWRVTLSSLLLLVPIVLSWFLMLKLRYMLQYVPACIPVVCLTVLLSWLAGGMGTPGLFSAALTGFFSILVVILRIYSRVTYGNMKQEFLDVHGNQHFDIQEREMQGLLNSPKAYHWVWFTILYVPGMFLRFTTYLHIMFGIMFVDVFLCLGYYYISSLYEYARANQEVANFPFKTMCRIHRMSGIIGALLLVLFLLPAVLYGREFQPDLTTDKPLVEFEEPERATQQVEYTPEIADTQLIEAMKSQNRETPQWLLNLCKIMGYVCAIFFIIMFALQVIRHFKRMGKDFSVEEEDEVVFLEPDQTDSVAGIFRRKGRDSFLSANQQIRKRYRKMIKKASKEKPNSAATPSELEKNAGLESNPSVQTLHNLYEKARYSEEGCTGDDLKSL